MIVARLNEPFRRHTRRRDRGRAQHTVALGDQVAHRRRLRQLPFRQIKTLVEEQSLRQPRQWRSTPHEGMSLASRGQRESLSEQCKVQAGNLGRQVSERS